jgi:hypothetical protein
LSIKNAPLSDFAVFKEGISGEVYASVDLEELYLWL